MKFIDTKERSRIDIPFDEVGIAGSKINVRQDVIDNGSIDIRFLNDRLSIQINGIIGVLPLTSDLSLNIQPKFPIENLNKFVYRSEIHLKNPLRHKHYYQRIFSEEILPIPLIKRIATLAETTLHHGMLRLYECHQGQGYFRPKVNFIKSGQRFWSRALPLQSIHESFDFTADNEVNQTVKKALILALRIARQTTQLSSEALSLSQSLTHIGHVSDRSIDELLSCSTNVSARVPAFRQDYSELLGHSIDMLLRVDVDLKKGRMDTKLGSYIISLEEVFERYIRNVLHRTDVPGFGFISTVDGNKKQNNKPLFYDNPKFITKPDLIIRHNHITKIIGDVKYRMRPNGEDRYQVISHALSHGAKRALLVYPKPEKGMEGGVRRLGFIGSTQENIEVYEYYFDLSGELDNEEKLLRSTVQKLTISETNDC